MIWMKDVAGNYLLCNTEFEKFFGAKESEIVGKTDFDFVDKKLAEFFQFHDKRALHSPTPLLNEEWVTYASDQRQVLLDTTKTVVKDAEGKTLGVLGIGHNVTERDQRERTLEEINEFAQNLANSQQVLLSLFEKTEAVLFKWQNNEKRDLEYVSTSAEKLFGYTKDEFLEGKLKLSDCIYYDDLTHIKTEIQDMLDQKLEYFKHEPYRIVTKDEEEKWVLAYTVSQKNENGEVTHFLGYLTDITEYKQQESIIFQQSKMISMAEMIENIAHQWRQPLSVISSSATGLEFKKQVNQLNDEELVNTLQEINNNAQYLSQTINDFRDLVHSENRLEEFSLESVVRNAIKILASDFQLLNIEVITHLTNEHQLFNQANYLLQSLLNILNNAKDAISTHQQTDRIIIIETKEENNNIIVTIQDSGGGIEKAILNRVFEPYVTTKHQSIGTGLGLNIVYNFITKGMKGKISCENREFEFNRQSFKGALFTLSIPKHIRNHDR